MVADSPLMHLYTQLSYIAGVIWLIALLSIPSNGVAQVGPPLFSPYIHLVENRDDEIILAWDEIDGVSPQGVHRVLFFAHGSVDEATHAIERFEWKQESDDGWRSGSHEDFQALAAGSQLPRVELRELGTMRGSRIAALTLRLGYPQRNRGVFFPRGVIRIQFSEQDSMQAAALPEAISTVASRLCLNDPPRFAKPPAQTVPKPAPYTDRRALKVIAHEAGVIHLPATEIIDALGDALDVSELALYRESLPAQFLALDHEGLVKREGALAPQDRIVFHSPASVSPYSPKSVSWLARDKVNHRFMMPLTQTDTQPAGFLQKRIRLEEDRLFIYGRDTSERQSDFWMWSELTSGATKTLTFPADDWVAGGAAEFRARFAVDPIHVGISERDVHLESPQGAVELTGAVLDQGRLDVAGTVHLPDTLEEGLELILSATDAQRLQSRSAKLYLDWAEVSAPAYAAAGGLPYRIELDKRQDAASTITFALPDDAAYALWVSDEDPTDARFALNNSGATYEAPGVGSLYFLPANTSIGAATLAAFEPDSPAARSLFQPAEVDVIMIAPWAWRDVLQRQVDSFYRKGYRARVVSIEAIYDCFGDGRLSPHAIRNYLRYIQSTGEGNRLSYVLLVGDATWDYWGRYQNDVVNIVPGFRGHTDYAVENWFVRLHDAEDPIPDMMIARWPVRTEQELVSLIQKTVHYKERLAPGDWLNRVLLTTDDGFESYMDELDEHWLPQDFRRTRRHIRDYPLIDNIYLPPQMRQALKAKTSLEATEETVELLNQGQFLWLFFGHGAPNVIGNERIFFGGGSDFSDVRKLEHMEHPFILWAFSCETCRFDYPRERWNLSIGEDLLTHLDGGSVALVGATGRGFPHDHIALARGMIEAAFHWNLPTMGQQMLAAGILGLAHQRNFEPIDQFALLGDPTLTMPRWKRLEGELTLHEEEQRLDALWRFAEAPESELRARIWAQGEREIVFSQDETIPPGQREIRVTLPFGEDEQAEWQSVGIDAVETNTSQTVVLQGALPIPARPAQPVISPTTGRLPNLAFANNSKRIEPQTPRDGQTIFFHAEIENRGEATAEQIRVSGLLLGEDDQKETMRVTVGGQGAVIERLDPGESEPVRIRWDPVANAGEHRVALRIDPQDRITQEDDVTAAREWETRLHVLRKADVVIHEASASLTPQSSGQGYTLDFVIVNEGESAVENIVVEMTAYLRGQDAPATMRLPDAYSLQPEERRVFGGIGLPPTLEAVEIIVDPDEILDEETHENNRLRLKAGVR